MERRKLKRVLRPGQLKVKVEGLNVDMIYDLLRHVAEKYTQTYLSRLISSGDAFFHIYAEFDLDGVGDGR